MWRILLHIFELADEDAWLPDVAAQKRSRERAPADYVIKQIFSAVEVSLPSILFLPCLLSFGSLIVLSLTSGGAWCAK
jgi:hypothetical protein